MDDDNEEYSQVVVEGEDDDDENDEDYYDENDNGDPVEQSTEGDMSDEDDHAGENMGYQPTNPIHYLRMIRQILTGFQEEEQPEPTPPPTASLTDERIAADIASSTKIYPPKFNVQPIPSMLLKRELCRKGPLSLQDRVHLAHRFYPRGGYLIFQYHHQIFCGQYSRDGSTFMSAAQDRCVRLYDTGTWGVKKEINARNIGWSVIDIDYSPDQRWIIYSSWSEYVHICNLQGDFEIHDALDFRPEEDRFCLFSIKFSPDSTEILGGSSDKNIYVYDINRKERVVQVLAHKDDINTVCYLDETGTLLASGSDDNMVKIWDRRIIGSQSSSRGINNNGCVGLLPGHLQGITHISPKGDGRHLISNGKDQVIRLWDIRKMTDPSTKIHHPSNVHYDYRYSGFGGRLKYAGQKHPSEKSIQSYRGHGVYQTLIRSYFSPASTTGQKYIYSGSYDGCIYVYDVVSGDIVTKLRGHRKLIRDVSWHPYDMQIVSTSWDGSIWKWDLQETDPLSFQGRPRTYVRSIFDEDA